MKKQPSYFVGAALAALVLAGCATMPEIKHVKANADVDASHFYYWLPKTELVAELPIVRTTRSTPLLLDGALRTDSPKPTPEEYVEYLGQQMDGFDKTVVPLKTTRTYALTKKDVTLTTRGIQDPDAKFDAGLQASWYEKMKLTMEFSQQGVMQKGEVETTNLTVPVVVATAKAVVTIAAIAAKGTFISTRKSHEAGKPPLVVNTGWKGKVDEAILALDRVKAARKEILTGKATFADAEQMKLALAALEKEEKDLSAALFGAQEEKTWLAVCHFAPTPTLKTAQVAKLHEAGGFEPLGEYVYNQAVNPFAYDNTKKTVTDWRHPKLREPNYDAERDDNGDRKWGEAPESVQVVTIECESLEPKASQTLGKISLQPESGSYVYRVPQRARLAVLLADDKIGAKAAAIKQAEAMVAQLGELRQLPRKLGTFSGSYAIKLDAETGALTTLTANADPGDLAGTIASASEVVKARQEAKKAEAEANTPEAKLKKERAYLEDQKAVRDLRAELGQTDSSGN